jgi:hypothetical protein
LIRDGVHVGAAAIGARFAAVLRELADPSAP